MNASRDSAEPVTSFRDPAGCVLQYGGRVFRFVNAAGATDLKAFLDSRTARAFLDSGQIVGTTLLGDATVAELRASGRLPSGQTLSDVAMVAEHTRIAFPTYPYEWAPEMLHAAGELTLELARAFLEDGLGLKDGTPYNILFRGPEPVFIDVLSVERRDPGDPTWLPYAQFVRTFLLPLAAQRFLAMRADQLLAARRDGLEPEELYRWLRPWQRFRSPMLSLVSMPTWLAARHREEDSSIYRKRSLADPEKARFIVEHTLGGLRRALRAVRPKESASHWSAYMQTHSYAGQQFADKESFVKAALAEFRPQRVLDVGCNTGHFSRLAAQAGSSVVAIDYDPAVVGQVWRMARAENLDILPLVVDLTRPSPGVGWRNCECLPFLERAHGAFDCILMLAVIHHMLVSERVPLGEILRTAAELTNDIIIAEFIGPEDAMFRRLTRGRESLHADLNTALFESLCAPYFDIVRSQQVEGAQRWMYLLRKKPEAARG
jgi:SAM-dependent methyltransferase